VSGQDSPRDILTYDWRSRAVLIQYSDYHSGICAIEMIVQKFFDLCLVGKMVLHRRCDLRSQPYGEANEKTTTRGRQPAGGAAVTGGGLDAGYWHRSVPIRRGLKPPRSVTPVRHRDDDAVVTGGAANLLALEVGSALEMLAAVDAGKFEIVFHILALCCSNDLVPSTEWCEIRGQNGSKISKIVTWVSANYWVPIPLLISMALLVSPGGHCPGTTYRSRRLRPISHSFPENRQQPLRHWRESVRPSLFDPIT